MIEARQALTTAIEASAKRMDARMAINIVVDPKGSSYGVVLVPLAPLESATTTALELEIDAQSGKVSKMDTSPRPNPLLSLRADLRQIQVVRGLEAYQAALDAIKGYEHYDKFGRLEIRLDQDHYKVTFPEPGAQAGRGRGPDFAYQVWIDARTKEVKKLLAAS